MWKFALLKLETELYYKLELYNHNLLPDLIYEVTSEDIREVWRKNDQWRVGLEQWRTLVRVLDILEINRHPWFGDFFDVVTEFYGRSFRKYELIDKIQNELPGLQDLMTHQSRLLQEGGFLDSSDEESESIIFSGESE